MREKRGDKSLAESMADQVINYGQLNLPAIG